MNAAAGPIESILVAAVDIASEEERRRFVEQACGGDAELKARVEELIANHFRAGSFLEAVTPPLGVTLEDLVRERPGTVIGPFTLVEQIGEGGFGVVFRAEQTQPVRRKVALKVLKPGMDTRQVVARFEAERQALAILDHPHIARVIDGGATPSGRPYFVMELVKGVPITDYCDQHHLTLRQRLELFVPVCSAVQHAHTKGIIHRDLKPSNVLVAEQDGVPVSKVIDFGVAKATGQTLTDKTLITGFGAIVGTLEYMSPEQAELNQLDIDTRSDVYSLGVLLYELLTGTTPLQRKRLKDAALLEILRVIREEEPQRPSARLSTTEELPAIAANRGLAPKELSGVVRGELDWIVMKCLEKDRNRRYDTANGLARDVERYLHDQPVQACPPSAWYQFRKFARRHRRFLVMVVVVLLALLLAVGGLIVAAVTLSVSHGQVENALTERTRAFDDLQVQKKKTDDALAREQQALANLRQEEQQTQRALYENLIALADREWWLNNIDKAEETLRRCPEHLRGWEWHYLQRSLHQDVFTLGGKDDRVMTTAYSPDGKILATLGSDLKLWDADTGQELRTLGRGVSTKANCYTLAFSPDGQRLAASLMKRPQLEGMMIPEIRVGIWDVTTGKESVSLRIAPRVRKLPSLRPAETNALGPVKIAFSPDGKSLATAHLGEGNVIQGSELIVKLWDAVTGVEVRTLTGKVFKGLNVVFSADGQRLAAGNRVWEADTGKDILLPTGVGRGSIMAISPDGGRFACVGAVGEIYVVDARTGARLDVFYSAADEDDEELPPFTSCLSFSPNGRLLAGPSHNRTVKLWADNGKEQLTLRGHRADITNVVFRPNGKQLATADLSGTVRVWDIVTTRRPRTLASVPVGFTDGRQIVMNTYKDGDETKAEMQVEEYPSGRKLWALRPATGQNSWAFSPGGQKLAAVRSQHTLLVWDATSGREVLRFDEPLSQFTQVNLSHDSHRLLAVDRVKTLRVWDVPTGKEVLRLENFPSGRQPILSPDGQLIARVLAGPRPKEGQAIGVWDATTGASRFALKGHTNMVGVVAFSPDGRRLASASDDQTIKLWDTATGQELRTLLGHTGNVTAVAFSPDGKRLASGGGPDKAVRIWDAPTGREILTLRGHTHPVSEVAFSRDGHRVLSRGQDGVRIWDGTPRDEDSSTKP